MFCRRVVMLLVLLGAATPLFAQSTVGEHLESPLVFEPNYGQSAPDVRFVSRGNGHSFFLKDREAVLAFANPAISVRIKLVGQNPRTTIEGMGRRSSVTNYFHGNDPSRWLKSVPNFEKIKYAQVYPGIDLVYYGRGRELEYDFEIQPLIDPSTIQIEFEGVDAVTVGPEGDLILTTPSGEIRHRRPVAYQRTGKLDAPVQASFVVRGNRVGFQVGSYDRGLPLTIDPTLVWSSYLGGTGNDHGSDITLDSTGNAYITGFTQTVSVETPPAVVTLQPPIEKGFEAFVTKLNSSGAVVYSTYFGGTPLVLGGTNVDDEAHSIGLDGMGNIYVVGYTTNSNFPIVNGFQTTHRGAQDAYLAKLDNSTGSIQFSTYIGGSQGDRAYGVAVDDVGNAYVAGSTLSTNFPVTNAFQPTKGGGLRDVFLTKVTVAGTVGFSTYLGGIGDEEALDVVLDHDGNIILTGFTSSVNFPLANAAFGVWRGGDDIFITKFNNSGTGLVFSTYWGGSGADSGVRLAVDSQNTIYITGSSASNFDFPLKNPAQLLNFGTYDAFLIKLHPDGRDADFSTFIGAEDIDGGTAVAVGSDGYIYLGGFTSSLGFYAINAVGAFLRGDRDGFIMKIAPDASVVAYSTYLGGFGSDGVTSLAVDASGNAYATGFSSFFGFPTAESAFQEENAGGQDAFVVKINADDIKTSVSYTFAANGGASASTAGQTAQPTFGYISADVASGLSPTGLAILDLRNSGVLLSEVSIPVPVPALVGRVYVTTSTASATALTLVNPNDEEVRVDLYFTGNGTGTNFFRNFNLPPHGQLSGFVYAEPYGIPIDQLGTLTYTATMPISGIALRSGQGTPVNVWLPIIDPYTVNQTPVTIPEFADGGGWSGSIFLINPTEEVITGEIRFFKEGLPGEPGQPFEVATDRGVASVFPYSIEPRQSFSTASHSATAEIIPGYAEVVASPGSYTPHAYAILNFIENSFLTTTVEGVPAANEFKMYAELSSTFPTEALAAMPAIALANSAESSATVTLNLIGFDGIDTGLSAVITLPPKGHVGRFLYEIPGFENLPSPFKGILRATTSQPGVTFAGFRTKYNELGRFMSTMTGPLKDLGNTNPIVFPHLVDGGGYATQFIVINGSAGAGASGTIRYLDPSGRPLNVAIAPE